MAAFMKNRRRLLLVLGDLFSILLANALAIALRFDFDWSAITTREYRTLDLLIMDLLITPAIFYYIGLYQGYWKYAGLTDSLRVARAVCYRTIALIVIFYGFGLFGLPRAVVIISTLLLLLFSGILRLAPRFHFEIASSRKKRAAPRTLIVGAGDTGEALLRELRKSPQPDYNPIGFLDRNPEMAGVKIHGVPVLGAVDGLEQLIAAYGVREVILAVPSASGEEMRRIFEICGRSGAHLRTVPTRGELERGAARINQIRLVELEDLLGRDVVTLDHDALRRGLRGRRVLITGAAGSIGREMVRQVAAYGPEELILLDRNENNMFYLEAELRETHPLLSIRPLVADVLDRSRLESIFRQYKPEILFHAAAYKHVPLMEHNPVEAIKNNVLATWRLAETAVAHGVQRFIYISTDKAVRPTSIMGATKRLGERLVKSLGDGATRFMSVRFGNVLGSDGSVIPTFRRQIAAGGPVTVTHPEATRYFMTIPEAVQLVLIAGVTGEGGETFLLQMGQPVRVLDLARNLIEMSGLGADQDIEIVFTGLRPGEKLHEELRNESEAALPTSNDKITILTGVAPLGEPEWRDLLGLESAALECRVEEALMALRQMVPDYVTPSPQGRPEAAIPMVVGFGARRRADVPL